MTKNYPALYATFACIAIFFGMGTLHLEQSAAYFGIDGTPPRVALETPEGAITLERTAYSYFSFWLANATYERVFAVARQPLSSGFLSAATIHSFIDMFPERGVRATLLTLDPENGFIFCGIRQQADGSAKTEEQCAGTKPIALIRVVFAKPTSLKEKAHLFRDGIIHTCLEYGIARIL